MLRAAATAPGWGGLLGVLGGLCASCVRCLGRSWCLSTSVRVLSLLTYQSFLGLDSPCRVCLKLDLYRALALTVPDLTVALSVLARCDFPEV